MTTQEKIAQLAQAALRSGPPTTVPPKPATFMPTYELPPQQTVPAYGQAQPQAQVQAPVYGQVPGYGQVQQAPVQAQGTFAAFTAVSATAAAAPAAMTSLPVSAAPATFVAAPAATAAPVYKDTEDPELRALLDEQEARMKGKLKRQRRTVNVLVLACLAATGVWYSKSPWAQAQVASLIPALRQTVGDAKLIAGGTKQYDKSLEKIKAHGGQIDEATRAMGVNPDAYSKDDDPDMDNEMKQFMGGEGKTTGDRNRALKGKFGMIGKLIGGKGGDASTAPKEGAPAVPAAPATPVAGQ